MAITDENTVLVLGAGVSVPFGLPLGGQLIEQISDQLEYEENTIFGNDDSSGKSASRLQAAVVRSDSFYKTPIYGTICSEFWDASRQVWSMEYNVSPYEPKVNYEINRIRDLIHLLQNQTSETIDDFIDENPSYSKISKIAIASNFISKCYDLNDRSRTPKRFDKRMFSEDDSHPKNRNWVHLLINIIRQGIRTGSVSEQNKIQIITFNYDTILEYVLEMQFSNTEANYGEWHSYINIIHMHGQCGDIEDYKLSPQEQCANWANGIHVVNESDVPSEVQKNRESAIKWIEEAKEIYFCGFSFSGPNCRLLGLDKLNQFERDPRLISACNYDGNVGISKVIQKFKKSSQDRYQPFRKEIDVEEAAGTPDKPLSVVDWLRLGYLGELPG